MDATGGTGAATALASASVAVTGAAGKTGRHVVSALLAAGADVHALVREATSPPAELGGTTVIAGELADRDDLAALLAGCFAVYHIPPNMSDDELLFARTLLAACRRTGVERIVYHSVLHPHLEVMPHHWAKLRVEELLLSSPLDVTILQPAPYVQNLDPYLQAARAGRPRSFPYGPHVELSMVDLRDVADAAVQVLGAGDHVGGTYQLCSGERLTQGEAWQRSCARLGLTAPYRRIEVEQWRRTVGDGLEPRVADWLASMFLHYEEHGLVGSAVPLTALVGRAPRTLDDHLDDLVARWPDETDQAGRSA